MADVRRWGITFIECLLKPCRVVLPFFEAEQLAIQLDPIVEHTCGQLVDSAHQSLLAQAVEAGGRQTDGGQDFLAAEAAHMNLAQLVHLDTVVDVGVRRPVRRGGGGPTLVGFAARLFPGRSFLGQPFGEPVFEFVVALWVAGGDRFARQPHMVHAHLETGRISRKLAACRPLEMVQLGPILEREQFHGFFPERQGEHLKLRLFSRDD